MVVCAAWGETFFRGGVLVLLEYFLTHSAAMLAFKDTLK